LDSTVLLLMQISFYIMLAGMLLAFIRFL